MRPRSSLHTCAKLSRIAALRVLKEANEAMLLERLYVRIGRGMKSSWYRQLCRHRRPRDVCRRALITGPKIACHGSLYFCTARRLVTGGMRRPAKYVA